MTFEIKKGFLGIIVILWSIAFIIISIGFLIMSFFYKRYNIIKIRKYSITLLFTTIFLVSGFMGEGYENELLPFFIGSIVGGLSIFSIIISFFIKKPTIFND